MMGLCDVRALAYRYLSSVSLPAQRFFEPLPCFWDKLNEAVPQGVQLVDSGCGTGALIDEAFAAGRSLIGIDIAARDVQHEAVVRANAITYNWSAEVWPLVCRPSHDGWAYETMIAARKRGAAYLYVGLPSNYLIDLGYVRSVCFGVVGVEGEKLYFVRPYKKRSFDFFA
jgi:hypothetical protein